MGVKPIMQTTILRTVRLLTVALAAVFLAGCVVTAKRPTVSRTTPVADKATNSDAEKSPADEADEAEKLADTRAAEDIEDVRKLAKLERDMVVARHRFERARMSADHTNVQHAIALTLAEQNLDLERQRLQTYMERSVPNRKRWAELRMQQAADRVKDAEEELHQLELLYADEEFADQTKDIVLERGRRRLERSRRDLELRREDHAILMEKTIPRETVEHEMKAAKAGDALDKARRDADGARVDKQIALMSAEFAIVQLEEQMQSHREKGEKRQRDRDREDRKKAKKKG